MHETTTNLGGQNATDGYRHSIHGRVVKWTQTLHHQFCTAEPVKCLKHKQHSNNALMLMSTSDICDGLAKLV